VGPVDYPSVGGGLAQYDGSGAAGSNASVVAQSLPFDGILTFRTQKPMTVSNYAEKMIFDQGLVSVTLPNRTGDSATYQITAPPEKIAVLVDSLKDVWPHCQQVALNVVDETRDSHVDIPNVLTEQIKVLAMEDSPEMLNRLAGQYASANINKENMFARDDKPADISNDLIEMPPFTIPIPTGRNEPAVNAVDPSQPTVRLRIQVERITE